MLVPRSVCRMALCLIGARSNFIFSNTDRLTTSCVWIHPIIHTCAYVFFLVLYRDLSNNNITRLEPMMFKPLFILGTLNLQNNRIRELENSTFFGLSSLTSL